MPSRTRLLCATKLPLLACALFAAACGAPEDDASLTRSPPPTDPDDVILAACEAPSLALPDGSCFRPGIPPTGCHEAFEHDGEYGCDPILPPEACAPGLMAVPGELACRRVMPCGAGRWGDLPVDATTQYVDGSFAGGGSDGSSDKPWKRVQQGYDAAAPGALIAIAEGRYLENLDLSLKPIRLWGVCPEKVSIEGQGATGTLIFREGTDGTEIGGIAVTSEFFGIGVTGATDITIDRVWIHDTADSSIIATNDFGPTSVRLSHSLLEGAHSYGVFALGSDFSILHSTVRNTSPRPEDKRFGGGFRTQMNCLGATCDPASRPIAVLERSLIDNNHTDGLAFLSSDLTMNGSVVRSTQPQASNQDGGKGLVLELACDTSGRCSADEPSRATIVGSAFLDNQDVGIIVSGSELSIETTVVRGTKPQASDQTQGVGIMMQAVCTLPSCDTKAPATGSIRTSLVEDNHTGAIALIGATATVEHTVARRSLPQPFDLAHGSGIVGQRMCDGAMTECDTGLESHLSVFGCLVEDSHTAGILTMFSEAQLKSIVIRRTAPREGTGLLGDGVVLADSEGQFTNTVDNLRIEDSARAGLASFGTTTSLANTTITCASFELAGEDIVATPNRFIDLGGNRCGCPEATAACKSVSAGLKAPEMLR